MIVETHELQAASSPRGRSPLTMAALAAVVVLTLAIGGVVGAHLLTGRAAGFGALAGWAGADAAMYAEVDLSLPGAQRTDVATLLDHWPALNPDLVLGDEFAGWVDDLLQGSDAPVSYAEDLAPWLSGRYAVVLSEWPAMPVDELGMMGALPEGALIVGSRDDAAAAAVAARLRAAAEAESGAAFTSSEHAGVTIWSLQIDPAIAAPAGNAEFAYAVADGAVILATGVDEVERRIDAHAGGATLATNAEAARLIAALPAQRIGLAVLDTRASLDAAIDGLADREPALADSLRAYAAAIPPLTVAALSVEADRVVMTSAATNSGGALAAGPLSEALAERIPAGSLFYASAARIGEATGMAVDLFLASLAADAATGPMITEWLDEFESTTGVAVRDLLAWADDVALYVDWEAGAPVGGMIALTTDPAAAGAQIDALVDALEEAAAGLLTVERAGGITRIVGEGMPPVEIAVGDVVALTVGEGEAARLASIDVATSLAGEARFGGAISAVGGSATDPAFWVDLAGIVEAVRGAVGLDGGLEAGMILANLEPLDHVASATRVQDGIVISRVDLVLR